MRKAILSLCIALYLLFCYALAACSPEGQETVVIENEPIPEAAYVAESPDPDETQLELQPETQLEPQLEPQPEQQTAQIVLVSPTFTTLNRNDTLTITCFVLPGDENDRAIRWSTGDPSVALVSDNGEVTAVGAGETRITAEHENGRSAECVIRVIVPVESITLSAAATEYGLNETIPLTLFTLPRDASDQTIHLQSSDSRIVEVIDNQTLLTKGIGRARITAVSAQSGVSASWDIRVVIPVRSIAFLSSEIRMQKGISQSVAVMIQPDNATNQALTFTSSAPDVATVSKEGLITAQGAGQAVITAISHNGLRTECRVTVFADLMDIQIHINRMRYKVGESDQLSVSFYPEDTTDKSFRLSSDNPGVVRIAQDGSFTCYASGEAILTAEASNGVSESLILTVLDMNALAAEVFRLTNQERANQGSPVLSGGNMALNSAAMIRSKEILSSFSHIRPDGRSFASVYDDLGGAYAGYYISCGENIAYGQESPQDALRAWRNSEEHWKNMLDPNYISLGIGVELDTNGTLYWVQLFS